MLFEKIRQLLNLRFFSVFTTDAHFEWTHVMSIGLLVS